MLNEPLVAIIVPVYNTEKYVEECLLSLQNQTYNNYIVIMINDGSTDSSLIVLKKFKDKNKNFILIDKRNGGVSSARNAGMDYIKGLTNHPKYIGFIDSDDKVTESYIGTFVKNLENFDADYSVCSFAAFDKKGIHYNNNIPSKRKMSKNDIVNQYFGSNDWKFSHHKTPSTHAFFLNNKFFKYENIKTQRFNEKISSCEDQKFFIESLGNLQKGICIPDLLFLYRLRKSSSTHQVSNSKDFVALSVYNSVLKNINCDLKVLKEQVKKKILYYSWKVILHHLSQKNYTINYYIYNTCRHNFFLYLNSAMRYYPFRLMQLILGKYMIIWVNCLKTKKSKKNTNNFLFD